MKTTAITTITRTAYSQLMFPEAAACATEELCWKTTVVDAVVDDTELTEEVELVVWFRRLTRGDRLRSLFFD